MANAKCPKCGMELPEVLLTAHVDACDEVSDEPIDDTQPLGSIRDFIAENREALEDDPVDMFPEIIAEEREESGGVAEASVDDEFQRLVGMLDLSEIGPMIPDVNVTLLDDAELSRRFNETREELMARGEMINCTTQIGRDLHSMRAAYIIELRKRGLLQ